MDLLPNGVKPRTDMQRLSHDQPIPEALRGAVIALGNFDGFHLGHQAVVGRLSIIPETFVQVCACVQIVTVITNKFV